MHWCGLQVRESVRHASLEGKAQKTVQGQEVSVLTNDVHACKTGGSCTLQNPSPLICAES